MDDVTGKFARRDVRRRRLLRRPGLLVAPRCRDRHRFAAWRQDGLHPDRHHHRIEPVGLLPRQQYVALKVLVLGTAEESRKAYDDRKCDVLTSDVSQLYAERLKLAAPDSHIILPEVISKEPLGPAVRQGDDQWFNLVKWTLYSLINAEELGVKQAAIDDAVKSS